MEEDLEVTDRGPAIQTWRYVGTQPLASNYHISREGRIKSLTRTKIKRQSEWLRISSTN